MKKLFKSDSRSSKGGTDDTARDALFSGRSAQPSPPAPSYRTTDPYSSDPYAIQPQLNPTRRDNYLSDNYQSSSPQIRNSRGSTPSINSSQNEEYARNALFQGRSERPRDDRQPLSDDSYSHNYGEHQTMAVADEDEDVEAIKQEMRFTKQESLSSTRNAIRIAAEAEEQGRNTLSRLGQQSERLADVEKNLDMASAHNRLAEDKASELKRLNRSIFAPTFGNPFNKASRAEDEERRIQDRHEKERAERETNRKFAYDSQQRVNNALTGKAGIRDKEERQKASLLERSRYQFEADDEDTELEKDIDANLDTLGDVAARLKGLAMATNAEIVNQNDKLDNITNKGDNLDTRLHLNTRRLDRIN